MLRHTLFPALVAAGFVLGFWFGACANAAPAMPGQDDQAKIEPPKTRQELDRFLDGMSADLGRMIQAQRKVMEAGVSIAGLFKKLHLDSKSLCDLVLKTGTEGRSESQLSKAARQLQETRMSCNMQYLQLQAQMQNENRSFTMISNIMKTKHDTVKNSISNIR